MQREKKKINYQIHTQYLYNTILILILHKNILMNNYNKTEVYTPFIYIYIPVSSLRLIVNKLTQF